MKPSILRTILAGLVGGVVINVGILLTFGLIGIGWNGGAILADPELQSEKLIKV